MTTLAVTGHRCNKLPDKITGYDYNNPVYKYLDREIRKVIEEIKPSQAISGLAIGVDTIFAEICIELKIPLLAAVPFVGQERIWPKAAKDRYNNILKHSSEVVIVCDGEYAPYKMELRNRFMVDKLINSEDRLLAIWDGTPGGTANCVDYARKTKKEIIRIDPKDYDKNSKSSGSK